MAKKKKNKLVREKMFNKDAIDYERLARCIAKAISEENDKRTNSYSITRELLKFLICPIFWCITGTMALLAVVFLITTFRCLVIEKINPLASFIPFMLALLSISIAVASFYASKEIDKEKDKQFVTSIFSALVSLVALIVSLAGFFRGMV